MAKGTGGLVLLGLAALVLFLMTRKKPVKANGVVKTQIGGAVKSVQVSRNVPMSGHKVEKEQGDEVTVKVKWKPATRNAAGDFIAWDYRIYVGLGKWTARTGKGMLPFDSEGIIYLIYDGQGPVGGDDVFVETTGDLSLTARAYANGAKDLVVALFAKGGDDVSDPKIYDSVTNWPGDKGGYRYLDRHIHKDAVNIIAKKTYTVNIRGFVDTVNVSRDQARGDNRW